MVEDEADMAYALTLQLEAVNYEVLKAADGLAGLDKARKEKPDLIILDLMLPKVDGFKVCALLKRDQRYAKIPVILLTARAQESDIKIGEECGANAYMTKPYDDKVLIAKIEELLKK